MRASVRPCQFYIVWTWSSLKEFLFLSSLKMYLNHTFLFAQSDWIRENCASQMDRVRENYNSQIQNLKDIRQYGSSQLSAVRGQYYEQVIFVNHK